MTKHTGNTVNGSARGSDGGMTTSGIERVTPVTRVLPTSDIEKSEVYLDEDEITDPSELSLPLDQVFEILKNQRRRYVLRYLASMDDEVSLSELAEEIAAWENGKDVGQISSNERKRVYVGLYQCHLPKMDGMDIISYNKPRGLIKKGENIDLVLRYIQADEQTNTKTVGNYAGLWIVCACLLLIAKLAEPVIASPLIVPVTVLIVAAGVFVLILETRDGTGISNQLDSPVINSN